MIIVLMGVSGSGKTTLGEALAGHLGWRFIDADDFHPPGNVAKMAAGTPLEDADRWPWLDRLNAELKAQDDAVLACSALRHAYRKRLLAGIGKSLVIFLRAPFELIEKRLRTRPHRYMPASLLQSQFQTLEPPTRAVVLDVSGPLEETLAELKRLVASAA